MATVRFGGGVADMRGSIGGVTMSRGKAGATARTRIKPLTHHSAAGVTRRAAFSLLTTYWGKTLTQVQRDAWNVYAASTNFSNRLGDTIQNSGMSCFVRLNALLLMIGKAIVTAAPVGGGHAASETATCLAEPTAALISIGTPVGGWVNTDTAAYLIFRVSAPQPAGRLAKPSKFAYLGYVAGASTPPTFPHTIACPFIMAVGNNVWIEITHVDSQGRVSAPTLTCVVAANP